MVHVITDYQLTDRRVATMFEDRKRLFVNLMRWDVPIIADRYEIDQFDGPGATYLIALDGRGDHEGSLRLLPTTGPHILRDIFPMLCDGEVPQGPAILEITRLCLPCRLGAERRRQVRDRLISAMVDHARASGIVALTGVVSARFRKQVLMMGWEARALGPPSRNLGTELGAFRIAIDASTPSKLAGAGIYTPSTITPPALHRAA